MIPARHILYYAAALGLLAGTSVVVYSHETRPRENPPHPFSDFPPDIGGWRASPNRELPARVSRKLAAEDYVQRTYTRNGVSLDLLAAYYADQRAGQAMHSPKNCLPGTGWEIGEMATLALRNGTAHVNRFHIQNGFERRVVLYWYQSRGRVVASEYASKLFLAWDAAWRGRGDGSVVRITSVNDDAAMRDALDFADRIIPIIEVRLHSAAR